MFTVEVHSPYVRIETAAKIANAVLEAEEQKCERVYVTVRDCPTGGVEACWVEDIKYPGSDATALLWNVETRRWE